jgi:hypothetical protein
LETLDTTSGALQRLNHLNVDLEVVQASTAESEVETLVDLVIEVAVVEIAVSLAQLEVLLAMLQEMSMLEASRFLNNKWMSTVKVM